MATRQNTHYLLCKNVQEKLFKIMESISFLFFQIVSPYNHGRSSKSSELQGKKSLRELVEMCIDVIAAEAQVIEVQKPVDQHQGQILEEEGTKYLGHACHHVSEVQYCLMKRRSRFWHDDKLMRQVRLI